MKHLKSYFLFSREHRSGIFLLILLIIGVQVFIFCIKDNSFVSESIHEKDKYWISMQSQIDSIKDQSKEYKYTIQPFNPNFISDYKGYQLGMSSDEIDRLHEFRKLNKFVNSAEEFQKVTNVSVELLAKIKPYFKFPDWINNKKTKSNFVNFEKKVMEKIIPVDINMASKEDLMKVYGIGDKISDIIISEKMKFGSFASIDQLQFVWGVSPEVFESCKKRFFVNENEDVKKVKINVASMKELARFPYFNYSFAKEIVTYRSMNGNFKNVEDLAKINNCPLEKLKIIALYLSFD
ncbi:MULTISPECIES: helix-hairpin-helix domain-containing protein [Flavobacterium]|uniref:Helix-hairpin-helix domain-containing protein n=1 Tax=Flavobacterium jumunjinense TaxID=998845 RepID=A0ABV5GQ60_9FLAO|nr:MULTISPECIES: helix-hairpin-helix domain-containing protein [Flavobacterium]